MAKDIMNRKWDSLTQFIEQFIKPNNIEYEFVGGYKVVTRDIVYTLAHNELYISYQTKDW